MCINCWYAADFIKTICNVEVNIPSCPLKVTVSDAFWRLPERVNLHHQGNLQSLLIVNDSYCEFTLPDLPLPKVIIDIIRSYLPRACFRCQLSACKSLKIIDISLIEQAEQTLYEALKIPCKDEGRHFLHFNEFGLLDMRLSG